MSKSDTPHLKLSSYIFGFAASVVLTLTSYFLVVNQSLNRKTLISFILVLAMVQFTIQIIYFLHLGSEQKPRWKTLAFGFMFTIVLILVVGTIWIMNNLNYNTMNSPQLLHHMKVEEGI
ncbi:MAG: cytochrome o ubiquinol oxidase subunit IV [Candidatus Saccharimonadales bacterium]